MKIAKHFMILKKTSSNNNFIILGLNFKLTIFLLAVSFSDVLSNESQR